MESANDYSFADMHSPNNTDMLPGKYHYDNLFHAPIPYHLQASSEWMNSPATSTVSTPSNSPTTPSPHLSNSTLNHGFPPQQWPAGPTSSTESTQSAKELQRLTDAKSRRRQQNRESQRAFRERKNKHIEHLEQALADLQHRHEKLLQSFVGLTARVSGGEGLGSGLNRSQIHRSGANGDSGMGLDLGYLDAQRTSSSPLMTTSATGQFSNYRSS